MNENQSRDRKGAVECCHIAQVHRSLTIAALMGLQVVAASAAEVYGWQEFERRDQPEAHTVAELGRLTLEKDDGGNLQVIDRSVQPEVWYRVTLNTPVGHRLSLICEWIDPIGRIVHRNRYTTKLITRTPWPTRARYRLRPDSAVGKWRVRMMLNRRELHSLTFRVRE